MLNKKEIIAILGRLVDNLSDPTGPATIPNAIWKLRKQLKNIEDREIMTKNKDDIDLLNKVEQEESELEEKEQKRIDEEDNL